MSFAPDPNAENLLGCWRRG